MGLGSSGSMVPPDYAPMNESEEALVYLLLADEKVAGPNGRSLLSTSFRKLMRARPPRNIDKWKARWRLDRWERARADARLEALLRFIWVYAESAKDEDEVLGFYSGWANWLPGHRWNASELRSAAKRWLDGSPWTEFLQLALGTEKQRIHFRRLWQGENPDSEDNSGDALLMRFPDTFEPLVFTWNPTVETRTAARDRLGRVGTAYFDEVEGKLEGLKRTRAAINEDHVFWLARRLILGERPVATARHVHGGEASESEISTIREGQKSAAQLIGLELEPAPPGPSTVL